MTRGGPQTELAGRVLQRLVVAAACVLSVLLGARALLTIDPYFDTFAYHLPFAARVIGLCPSSPGQRRHPRSTLGSPPSG